MAWSLPDYDEIQAIGPGSTGLVMLARDRATGTLVAVKYLSKQVYRSAGFAERCRNGALALATVESEHVAMLYEYVEGPDSAALVMEFVDGVSLRQVIDHSGPLDPPAALYVARAALVGLDAIHNRDMAHGDLRPENLLIDARGIVKIVDTGIRAQTHGDARYLAPELAAGQQPTPASDVYAAAVTLLECLTGIGPRAVDKGRVAGAESLREAGAPEPLQTLLAHELAVEPVRRSPSAAALIEALERAARSAYGDNWLTTAETSLNRRLSPVLLSGRSGAADAVVTDDRPWRRRLLVLAAVLLLVVVVGIFAVARGLFGPGSGATADADPGPTPAPLPTSIATLVPGAGLPTLALSGTGGDAVRPSQPVGLIIGGTGSDQAAPPAPSDLPSSGSTATTTQPPGVTSPIHLKIVRTPRPAPACTTTIEADVTVTGGLLDIGNVHLTYTINGVTKTTTVLIDIDNITVPVVLSSSVSGHTSGSATVTVTGPSDGPSVTTTWDPTAGC
jgi:eukaryotic-like serine/threonine-protein kinase